MITNINDEILLMTRSPVPSNSRGRNGLRLKQVAIMPFRKKFLVEFDDMPMMQHERTESIELLRAVEERVKAIKTGFLMCLWTPSQTALKLRLRWKMTRYSNFTEEDKIVTIQNSMKQALKDGNHVFGTWSMLSSPIVLNVIATSGLDFVIIDLEHGPTTFETAENQLFAAEAGGIQPIIRLSDGSAHSILHALEIGANSILFHKSQLPTRRSNCPILLYFPDGNRGLSPFTRTHGFSDEGLAEKLVAANQKMFVGVLVEGEEGINNLPEIVQVDGIDMVYWGFMIFRRLVECPVNWNIRRCWTSCKNA